MIDRGCWALTGRQRRAPRGEHNGKHSKIASSRAQWAWEGEQKQLFEREELMVGVVLESAHEGQRETVTMGAAALRMRRTQRLSPKTGSSGL